MKDDISDRILKEAEYIIQNGSTIRSMAVEFKLSKSTIHKDLSDRLLLINKEMYNEVKDIFKYHISIRHINGGNSARIKWKGIKK